MPITPLNTQEKQQQLTVFVDFFVREFMAEIDYLESVARGNAPERQDATYVMLFNIASALVSLAPVPGAVLTFVALPHIVKAVIKAGQAAMKTDWAEKALAIVSEYLSGDIKDQIDIIRGSEGDSYTLEEGKSLDKPSLEVLVRWLGHQLARRYEQALTERLSTQPDQALVGLTRVAARRCLAFLSENLLCSLDYKTRIDHLLSGVVIGGSLPWYHRPLSWLKTGEKLQGRDEAKDLSMTAEKLLINGAWISKTATGVVQCYTHAETEWLSSRKLLFSSLPEVLEGLPKYGYVSGTLHQPELQLYSNNTIDLLEWQHRRLHQPISKNEIAAYLSSPDLLAAKAENRTSELSLAEYLHRESPSTFSAHAQVFLYADLRGLDLSSGNFDEVDFSGSQFSGDFSYSQFRNANLYACVFEDITSNAESRVCFEQARLSFSTFIKAHFGGVVDFTQADLTCANLTEANFGSVEHIGTVWHKTILKDVRCDGLREAQVQQITQMNEEQKGQQAKIAALDQQIEELEAKITECLSRKNVSSEKREQLEDLLVQQVNRIQFEHYAREKLQHLESSTNKIRAMIDQWKTTLDKVQEEKEIADKVLLKLLEQLTQRIEAVEIAQKTTQHELEEIRGALSELKKEKLISDATQEEKDNYLIKQALYKIFNQYEKALSQKQQDLNYYIPSDVIERLPEATTSADYIRKIDSGEISTPINALKEAVTTYLNSSDQMMLLLGDPGAGKSLFAWHISQSRLRLYRDMLQGNLDQETPWVPVVIELKQYRLSELNGLLPHYLQEVCGLTLEELYAIQNDQNSQNRLFVVLDGFDELKKESDYDAEKIKQEFQDCFKTCGAENWFAGQIKIAVTCRIRHLHDEYMEKSYFGRGTQKKFYRQVLLPFRATQITAYLKERIKADVTGALLPVEEYQTVLESSESMNAMVRNPFILRLFVEALPELQRQDHDVKTIKRYDIYHAFVTQWFMREINRSPTAQRIALGVTAPGTEKIVLNQFIHFAGILAAQMFQHDSLMVSYNNLDAHDEAFHVWNCLDEIVLTTELDETALQTHLKAEYQKLGAVEKRRLQIKEKIVNVDMYIQQKLPELLDKKMDRVAAQLDAFKISSPLRKAGNQHSFIHKSFYEFFLGEAIVQAAGTDQPLSMRLTNTLLILTSVEGHALRRIQDEPQVLLFLEDIWIGKSIDSVIMRIKETFFAVIESSKGREEHGAAAANAITILNWMGVMLTHQSWQNIHIPGANLSYAVLMHSDLSGANLQRINLFHANLSNTILSHADLDSVDFGERAPIKVNAKIIACHPTLPWLAVAIDNSIRQYNLEHGIWINDPLEGHTDTVNSLAYSPDGNLLASGSNDQTIRQWVAATGESYGPVLQEHTDAVNSVVYSPDGRLLASGSNDKTIRQWESATGQMYGSVVQVGHSDVIFSAYVRTPDVVNRVVYSPDGKFLMSQGDQEIRQWKLDGENLYDERLILKAPNEEGFTCFAYSPDGKFFATGGWNDDIHQWVAATGEPFGPVLKSSNNNRLNYIVSLAYSPDGKYLASGDGYALRQWVSATGERFGPELYAGPADQGVDSIIYSPNRKFLISISDNVIRQHQVIENSFYPHLAECTAKYYCVAYSPDGKWVAGGNRDSTICQWVVATGEAYGPKLQGHTGGVRSVAYAPNGKLLASGSSDNTIRQWVAATGEFFGPVIQGHTRSVDSVVYSPDGNYLASGSTDNTIRQWVVATGEPFRRILRGHYIMSIAYSPDGRFLANGNWDGTIWQWEAATGKAFGPVIQGHTSYISSVAYSPDGRYLASGSDDKTICQWVAATGEIYGPVLLLQGRSEQVSSVVYSPDGRFLASGHHDDTIHQWIAATGEPFGPVMDMQHIARLIEYDGDIRGIGSVVYSPDGKYLASGGGDRRVNLWFSGIEGNFDLVWSSRLSVLPLLASGLQLGGVKGLRGDQRALLAYAGCEDASTDAVALSSGKSVTFFSKENAPQPQVKSNISPG